MIFLLKDRKDQSCQVKKASAIFISIQYQKGNGHLLAVIPDRDVWKKGAKLNPEGELLHLIIDTREPFRSVSPDKPVIILASSEQIIGYATKRNLLRGKATVTLSFVVEQN